mgnify:CR=1 FL=1
MHPRSACRCRQTSAFKLNYSDNAVSRWERGELAPSIEVLQNISEVYGIEIDMLLKENVTE